MQKFVSTQLNWPMTYGARTTSHSTPRPKKPTTYEKSAPLPQIATDVAEPERRRSADATPTNASKNGSTAHRQCRGARRRTAVLHFVWLRHRDSTSGAAICQPEASPMKAWSRNLPM